MSGDQPPPMATPRVASGALFHDAQGDTLLVKPTYKPRWDIPGGYVEPGETPRQACQREIREELSLDLSPRRLLVVDWAPAADEGDKVLFVFEGGLLSLKDVDRIVLPAGELGEFRFFAEADLDAALTPRLARRIHAAYVARKNSETVYLENGSVPAVSTTA